MKGPLPVLAALAVLIMPSIAQAQDAGCPALQDESHYKDWPAHRQLVMGADGWIFRSTIDFREKFTFKKTAIPYYKTLNDILAVNDIRVMVALLPTRGILHAAQAPDYPFDRQAAIDSYRHVADTLRAQGLLVATADNTDRPDYFYRRDHHWSAAGARDMALAVAAQVRQAGLTLPSARFITKREGSVAQRSAFGKPLQAICGQTLPPDTVDDYITYADSTSPVSLTGDMPVPDVILLGTSNSTAPASHANFDGFLKEALQADVLNLSVSGGGVDDAMLSYLTSDSFIHHKPSLIIWEFPVYQDFDSLPFLEKITGVLRQHCADGVLTCPKGTE